jgi:hypothetical protein
MPAWALTANKALPAPLNRPPHERFLQTAPNHAKKAGLVPGTRYVKFNPLGGGKSWTGACARGEHVRCDK